MVMGGDVCADANSVSNAMTAAANSLERFVSCFLYKSRIDRHAWHG
jgi:hypothetical protein